MLLNIENASFFYLLCALFSVLFPLDQEYSVVSVSLPLMKTSENILCCIPFTFLNVPLVYFHHALFFPFINFVFGLVNTLS